MSNKLTEEELIWWLDYFRRNSQCNDGAAFVGIENAGKAKQAYSQLKEIIHQKPRVSREWVKNLSTMIANGVCQIKEFSAGEMMRMVDGIEKDLDNAYKEAGVEVTDE